MKTLTSDLITNQIIKNKPNYYLQEPIVFLLILICLGRETFDNAIQGSYKNGVVNNTDMCLNY